MILAVVSVVWTSYAALFAVWGRPWAGLVATLTALILSRFLILSYRQQASLGLCVHGSLVASAAGLFSLALISGQQHSPFVWLITSLPVFAFCFLRSSEAAGWTLLSTILVLMLHSGRLPSPNEFQATPMETCGYQMLVVFLLALVSIVVKSLSYRHVEAIRQANHQADLSAQARARFTAHVSHEMRHPLQSITGVLELVDFESLPEQHRELVAQARRDARLLANLVDSTLIFSDLVEGDYVSLTQPFTLTELGHLLSHRFQQKFADRGVTYTLVCPKSGLLEGDRAAIEHVLALILDNSLKYTSPSDRVTVELAMEADRLKVEVSDTGSGMSADAKASNVEPFRREDELAQRKERGFGLGLALVDRLVRQMGGDWELHSGPGAGTYFTMDVRVNHLNSEVLPETEALHILVVDDDPVCLKVTQRLLTKLGHKVKVCSQSESVEELVKTEQFDLIFMDCQMPELDGYEASRLLRRAGFSGPIVALTANTALADRRRCVESGMTAVVAKPASLAKLQHTVNRYAG